MDRFFSSILERMKEIFDPEILGEAVAGLLANVMVAAATFAVYYLLWRILDLVVRVFTRRVKVDRTTREFTLTVLKFVILTLAVVNALAAAGVNTASLLTSLGIAGLTLGFAARDALSNLISGLLIYWDRPFVIGDLLEVNGQYGRVERITLRSTRVVTPDGRMLAVPNTEIINSTVASYTNFPHLRIDVEVSVGVAVDLDRAREILLGLVRADDGYMADPPPEVVVTQLNDYNVMLELRAWRFDERDHVGARLDLRERIYKAFTAEGIDMPFETLRLEPIRLEREGEG